MLQSCSEGHAASTAIPGFSSESQIDETCTSGMSSVCQDGNNVPLFVDPRYAPKNVRRRENRKRIKIRTLIKRMKL